MKYFYVDTMGAMAESIMTATSDEVMSKKIRALCKELMDHIEEEAKKQS